MGGVLRAHKSSTGWKWNLDQILQGFSGLGRMSLVLGQNETFQNLLLKKEMGVLLICVGPGGRACPISPFCLTCCFSSTIPCAPPHLPWLGVLWPRGPVCVTVALTRTKIPGEPYTGTRLEEDTEVPGAGMPLPLGSERAPCSQGMVGHRHVFSGCQTAGLSFV